MWQVATMSKYTAEMSRGRIIPNMGMGRKVKCPGPLCPLTEKTLGRKVSLTILLHSCNHIQSPAAHNRTW